ncbi:MAG: arginine repressor [Bacteroidota bacterium]|nr:arginine repressor [Bacteroidota bacterium]MDP4230979.1 arginine repressor [Bacteroidota bacterium]MDP4235285.1 arginine repressor [Bacteroidota bacterium]
MKKQQRQFLLKEIITRKAIPSQEELLEELKQSGESVNQATLSRDLREMGISRVNTAEGPRYEFSTEGEEKRIRTLISYEVQNITANESLIVVRTLPGRAQGVAEMLDRLNIPEVLATLAGDNTIFIAPKSVADIGKIEQALREFITHE